MVRQVSILDRLLAEVPTVVQRVYSQPRDMSEAAIEERAKKLAKQSSSGHISKDTSFKGDS